MPGPLECGRFGGDPHRVVAGGGDRGVGQRAGSADVHRAGARDGEVGRGRAGPDRQHAIGVTQGAEAHADAAVRNATQLGAALAIRRAARLGEPVIVQPRHGAAQGHAVLGADDEADDARGFEDDVAEIVIRRREVARLEQAREKALPEYPKKRSVMPV